MNYGQVSWDLGTLGLGRDANGRSDELNKQAIDGRGGKMNLTERCAGPRSTTESCGRVKGAEAILVPPNTDQQRDRSCVCMTRNDIMFTHFRNQAQSIAQRRE